MATTAHHPSSSFIWAIVVLVVLTVILWAIAIAYTNKYQNQADSNSDTAKNDKTTYVITFWLGFVTFVLLTWLAFWHEIRKQPWWALAPILIDALAAVVWATLAKHGTTAKQTKFVNT